MNGNGEMVDASWEWTVIALVDSTTRVERRWRLRAWSGTRMADRNRKRKLSPGHVPLVYNY